jgi:hypothetical protein
MLLQPGAFVEQCAELKADASSNEIPQRHAKKTARASRRKGRFSFFAGNLLGSLVSSGFVTMAMEAIEVDAAAGVVTVTAVATPVATVTAVAPIATMSAIATIATVIPALMGMPRGFILGVGHGRASEKGNGSDYGEKGFHWISPVSG